MHGLKLLAVGLGSAFGLASTTTPAWAQDYDNAIRGVKVVVPTARGRKTYGGTRLTRALRRALTDGVGPLISSRAFRDMQSNLQIKGKRRWSRRNLARVGREIGADYVLYVTINRKGWLYTARARFINTMTNEVQMDFRSQYYDPSTDTADRGERIAKRTLLKMQTLAEEGLLQISDPAPSPPLAPLTAESTIEPMAEPPVASLSTDEAPADRAPQASGSSFEPERPERPPLGEATDLDRRPASVAQNEAPAPPTIAPRASPPSSRVARAAAADSSAPRASERVQAQAPPPGLDGENTAVFRFDVSGGAGLLRRYDVSSASVDDSGLSFPLDPTSLVQAGFDVVIPSVGLGAELDFALRPVRYEVGTVGQEPDMPSGLLINTVLWATYHIILAGDGEQAVRLLPKIGGRLDMAPVDQHAANFVISTTAIAVVGGVELRWPVNRTLELGVAIDGGYIASYSEDPTTSGNDGAGFTAGGDLEVRIWLTSTIGIAFDSRYRYAQVDFDGVPTRQVPDAEQGELENVTVATQDLLTSVGVALRF